MNITNAITVQDAFFEAAVSSAYSALDSISRFALSILSVTAVCVTCKTAHWMWSQIKSADEVPTISDKELRETLLPYPPEQAHYLFEATQHLKEVGIPLTEDNLDELLDHAENAQVVSEGIGHLKEAGILTQDNLNALHSYPGKHEMLFAGIWELHNAELITQNNFDQLLQVSEHIDSLVDGLNVLNLDGILMQEHFEDLLKEPENAATLADGLNVLLGANVLTWDLREELLEAHEHAHTLSLGFALLEDANVLTENNRRVLREDPENAIDLAREIVENELQVQHENGADVHDRDGRVKAALISLEEFQGAIGQATLDTAVQECIAYIQSQADTPIKERALFALQGEGNEYWPALLGSQDPWAIKGLVITGEEVIGRLWIFANGLNDADKENAKISVIHALANSFEDDSRVCNPGKTGRLVTGVLQGNLPGVLIDIVEDTEITPEQAAGEFFKIPAYQQIDNTADLISEGIKWLLEHPNVVNREGFLDELRKIAELQDLTPILNP